MKQKLWLSSTILLLLVILVSYYFEPARTPRRREGGPTPPSGTYRVTAVRDGDTVVVEPPGGGERITCRLYGIDAPETPKRDKQGQPYGKQAMKVLKGLVSDRDVTVTFIGERTYSREVCRIEKDGIDINQEMIRRGYAWAYVEYLKRPHASSYAGAEEEARKRRMGLWQDVNPTPPWEFRKRQRVAEKG